MARANTRSRICRRERTASKWKSPDSRRLVRPDVILHVQDALAVDFEMPVGSVADSGHRPRGRAAAGYSRMQPSALLALDRTFVDNLPLNGRNFTFLAQLSAGVTQGQQDMRGLGVSGSFAANGRHVPSRSAKYICTLIRLEASGKSPRDGILSDTDSRITARALLQCYISSIGAA